MMDNKKTLDLMSRLGMINEDYDVMSKYFNIYSNGNMPQQLSEATINRIIDKHGKNGFIIVSANRSDEDRDTNKNNTLSLINDIKNSGYSYFPVYGGYKGTDGVVDEYEPSFFVANYDRNGNVGDFDKLKSLAAEWCGKYNQDSVLVKSPNDPPIYIDRMGNKVSANSSNNVSINNPNKEFFTALYKKPQGTNRFTYDINFECYCNPNPCTLNEYMRRKSSGELLIEYNGENLID